MADLNQQAKDQVPPASAPAYANSNVSEMVKEMLFKKYELVRTAVSELSNYQHLNAGRNVEVPARLEANIKTRSADLFLELYPLAKESDEFFKFMNRLDWDGKKVVDALFLHSGKYKVEFYTANFNTAAKLLVSLGVLRVTGDKTSGSTATMASGNR